MAVCAVAFDWGGVMTGPAFAPIEELENNLGLPRGLLCAYFRGDEEWALCEIDQLAVRDFFARLGQRVLADTGVKVDGRTLGRSLRGSPPLPEMIDLVKEVRTRCQTALLTNSVRLPVPPRDGLDPDLFSVIIDSCEVGVRKPDRAAFEMLVERLGCHPDQVVFFDDFDENVAAAAEAGLRAYRFADPGECRVTLVDEGVLLPGPTRSPWVSF